ncbi:hypothetical protein BH20GEM1_BH20GEM1_04740 [soil metagenome]
MVGWGTAPFEHGTGMDYTMWTKGESPVGGLMELPEEVRKSGAPPHWIGYVAVPDVDATAAKARKLGGTVHHGPADIPQVGRFAVIADPQGAVLAAYKGTEEMPRGQGPRGRRHRVARAAYAAARAHWQAQDPGYEEETRVLAVAEGAFTEPGVEQQAVLYLMSLWPRCCPKLGLAVIQDGALVRNVAFEASAQDLAAVPDLDGDGRDELVRTGSFGMGGQESTSITLVSFGEGDLRTWGGTSIQDSACAAMQEGGTAARITAVPGPKFTIERFAMASCETGEWQPAGAPEPFAFESPGEEAHVELPVR